MSLDIKRLKCQALTAQSNYTKQCKNDAVLNSKYCKIHRKKRRPGRVKTRTEKYQAKKRKQKLEKLRSKSIQKNTSDKQSRNSRFIISHGSTPTETPIVYPNYTPTFKLPFGVRIVLFEVAGRSFSKFDSGLIYNWILRTIEENNDANIIDLNETILKIGIPGSKDYYCRVYDNLNDVVPNILYTAEDPVTQVGVFKFTRLNKVGKCIPSYCTFRKLKGLPWQPQWDIASSDNDFNFELFGSSKIFKNIYNIPSRKFQHPYSDLYKVATYASKVAMKKSMTQTIYVISCRNFNSPSIKKAINYAPTHMKNLQNISNLYHRKTRVPKIFRRNKLSKFYNTTIFK